MNRKTKPEATKAEARTVLGKLIRLTRKHPAFSSIIAKAVVSGFKN